MHNLLLQTLDIADIKQKILSYRPLLLQTPTHFCWFILGSWKIVACAFHFSPNSIVFCARGCKCKYEYCITGKWHRKPIFSPFFCVSASVSLSFLGVLSFICLTNHPRLSGIILFYCLCNGHVSKQAMASSAVFVCVCMHAFIYLTYSPRAVENVLEILQ